MTEKKYTRKLAYIGAGCGMVFFGIFGLLPGSFLGGVMGLNIAGLLLGVPLGSGIAARLVVAASMVLGVMMSGMICITVSAATGWLLGSVVDAATTEKKELKTVEQN